MGTETVFVGIDEAGLGPLLGPLVVSSVSFTVERELLDADWWALLKRSVSKTSKKIGPRLLVTDSKKAYSKSKGIRNLQRTAMALLKCLGHEPKTIHDIFNLLSPSCRARLDDYPWYSMLDQADLSANHAEASIAASVFEDDLAQNRIKLLDVRSYCLDVAYYNKMIDSTKNKARVLFSTVAMLIQEVIDNCPGSDFQIIVDRQGGRIKYRRYLQTMFPDMELRILCQSQSASSYELKGKDKRVKLHFVVRADDRFFPVCLASMVSKYLRELLVANINRYFVKYLPELKPTAGYWQDGQRFIKEIKNIQYDSVQLVRSR